MPISAKEAKEQTVLKQSVEISVYLKDIDNKILNAIDRGHNFTQMTLPTSIPFPENTYLEAGYALYWEEIPKKPEHRYLHITW